MLFSLGVALSSRRQDESEKSGDVWESKTRAERYARRRRKSRVENLKSGAKRRHIPVFAHVSTRGDATVRALRRGYLFRQRPTREVCGIAAMVRRVRDFVEAKSHRHGSVQKFVEETKRSVAID